MNVIGLIAEYNPFHNGHKYQIDKIKKLYPNSLIICIISTSFSQRGEISLLNKWDKTKIALNNNIDIVLELPYFFTVQSADTFAHASLQILNEFKIDTLAFGSEIANINKLNKMLSLKIDESQLIKKYSKKGYNYPSIISKIYNTPKAPNDILAVSYLKEIKKNNYNIKPLVIKRTNNYHDTNLDANIVSASNVREKFYSDINLKKYVPDDTYKILKNKKVNKNKYIELVKYKVFTDINLNNYLDVDEGLDNKIVNTIFKYNNEIDIIKNIKSKRYTFNKISRMLNHILVGLTKEDAKSIKDIEYIRILGFNELGRKYLNSIKKNMKYLIIYNYNKKFKISNYELISTKIYTLLTNELELIEKEYRKNVTIL